MDQRRLWLVLLIVLGVSLPVAVAAMPGLESSEDAHHGSRSRSHARLVWRTPLSRAIAVISVASVRLPRPAPPERSARPMPGTAARKIPPSAASSPAAASDH